jgi:hypothetical protein
MGRFLFRRCKNDKPARHRILNFQNGGRSWSGQNISNNSLKVGYSPYVKKAFVYISVFKILNFIRQLLIFSCFCSIFINKWQIFNKLYVFSMDFALCLILDILATVGMWEFYMHANCWELWLERQICYCCDGEKKLNICYTASAVGNRNFIHITNHFRRCKIYIYTVSKGKLIKEDIYTRLDESKVFIGLLVNLMIYLIPYDHQ